MMWLVIGAIGLGTYVLRLSMLLLFSRRLMGDPNRACLQYVAPAALAALVTTMLAPNGTVANPVELLAVVAGFAASRRSGNVLHALAVGLPVLLVIDAVGHLAAG
jgi:branched-subunit amino acid transport protein